MAIVRKRKLHEPKNNTRIDSFYKPITKETVRKNTLAVDENASIDNEKASPSPSPPSSQNTKGGLKILGDNNKRRVFGDNSNRVFGDNSKQSSVKTFGEQKQQPASKLVRQPLKEKSDRISTHKPEFRVLRDDNTQTEINTQFIPESDTQNTHFTDVSISSPLNIFTERVNEQEGNSPLEYGGNSSQSSLVLYNEDRADSPLIVYKDQDSSQNSTLQIYKDQDSRRNSPLQIYRDEDSRQNSPLVVYTDQDNSQNSPLAIYKDEDNSQDSQICRDQNSSQNSALVVYKDEDNSQNSPLVVYKDEDNSQNSPLVVYKDEDNSQNSPLVVYKDEDSRQNSPLAIYQDEDSRPNSPLVIYQDENSQNEVYQDGDSQAEVYEEDEDDLPPILDTQNDENEAVCRDEPSSSKSKDSKAKPRSFLDNTLKSKSALEILQANFFSDPNDGFGTTTNSTTNFFDDDSDEEDYRDSNVLGLFTDEFSVPVAPGTGSAYSQDEFSVSSVPETYSQEKKQTSVVLGSKTFFSKYGPKN